MATRRRRTDDELFDLADTAHERWGTVTVSALQHAAGGGSAARFKKIIEQWKQRRNEAGETSPVVGASGGSGSLIEDSGPGPDDSFNDTEVIAVREPAGKPGSRSSYDRLLTELQETRRAHAAEKVRLNSLIDALMDELQARR